MTFCEPRYAPPRRRERKTYGARVANMAEMLGTPLMGWQRLVADIGLEQIEVNGLLIPAYREIVVTIPRQNGKTTLVLSWELSRACLWGVPQRIAYTAQTGLDARKKIIEDQLPLIERSEAAPFIRKVRRKNGEEGIDFFNGSQLDVQSSTESAGHGRTLDLGVIDEAFKDQDDRREGAMLPAMTTRADAQLLVVSTMGTEDSTYLNRKVRDGRAALRSGRDDSVIAYFEWSAPEDADIDDPRTWQGCMPAWDLTIWERTVRHARQTMSEGEFRRAFLNQMTAADERVIPQDVWNAVLADVAPDGNLVFGIDCNPERSSSAISVADSAGNCEVVEANRGTGWLVPVAVERAKRWNAPVALDPSGPAGVFKEDLERAGVRVIPVAGRDMASACGYFFDSVIDKLVQIRPHESLNLAVAAAQKRSSGDAWVWARRDAISDLSPLVATTIALWAVKYGRGPMFVY